MKIIKKCIGLLFLLLVFTATSYSQNKVKSFIEKSQAKFKLDYTNPKGRKVFKSNQFADPFIKPFNSDGRLTDVSLVSFTSKKKYNGAKLYFDIYVYEYKNAADAATAYKKVSSGKDDKEIIFDKDYDFVSLNSKIIVRVNANCVYSQSAWKKLLKDVLLLQSECISKNSQSSMECNCGKGCW